MKRGLTRKEAKVLCGLVKHPTLNDQETPGKLFTDKGVS